MSFRNSLPLVLLLLVQFLYSQDSHSIKIDDKDLILIGKKSFFLIDSSRQLTFEDILQPDYQAKFKRGTKDYTNFVSSKLSYWIKFSIKNTSRQQVELRIGKGWIAEVDFYSPTKNGSYEVTKTGYLRPFHERQLVTNQYRFQLADAQDSTERTFYIKLRTYGYALEAPLYVGTTTHMEIDQQHEDWFSAMYSGAAIIMILFSFITFIGSREITYLYYMLYMMTLLFMIPYLTGAYPQFWLFREWGALNFYYFFIVGFNPLFVVLFIQSFLKISWKKSVQLKISYLLCIITLCFGFINFLTGSTGNYNLWLPVFSTSFLLTGSIFYLSILILVFTSFTRGKRQARYLLVGWSTYFLGVWLAIAAYELEIIPLTFYTTKAIMFGSFFEIIMFSLALTDNINILKAEKDKAQQQAIFQARENEYLIKKQNDVLELEVVARTRELKDINQALRKKEHDLEDAIKEKELLMKVVAHDLKSPLNVIQGFSKLIVSESKSLEAERTLGLALKGKSLIETLLVPREEPAIKQ